MFTKFMKYLPYNKSETQEKFHAFYIPPLMAIQWYPCPHTAEKGNQGQLPTYTVLGSYYRFQFTVRSFKHLSIGKDHRRKLIF